MKVSRDQMQANRLRILEEASRLFRAKGFDAVGVAEVMQAAGLTHGGFYGHFKSKEDLFAQSVAHVFSPVTSGPVEPLDIRAFLTGYLSPAHRTDAAGGCPTAALGADVQRQSTPARAAMTEGVRVQLKRVASALSDDASAQSRRDATGVWATMVGALLLSRAVEDEAFGNQILSDAQAWLEAQVDTPPR
ncbi:MAG: TetR/AcrR family transcriptional regulator [Caulobacteraceae bacterium]|nr:MAG: TetR/AcrR family transcriptional regulator [Caulobacteraceae bacterium]